MVKKILLAAAAVLVVFLLYVSTRPADFILTRSATIAAPPAKVYAVVNDISQWNSWSPFAKQDPEAKYSFSGPKTGVGAVESWTGAKAGEGKMTLSASEPGKRVEFQLEFVKPMAAHNVVEFTFAPDGKGTKVTWSMSGKHNFLSKVMDTLVGMEKMVGPMFEEGLKNLKTKMETK